MIHIDHSSIFLLGREIPLYTAIPILAMVAATGVNTGLAKRYRLDSSLVFRWTAVLFFAAILLQMFNDKFPVWMLALLYLAGALGIPLIFYGIGCRTGFDRARMTGLGVLTVSAFVMALRLGCFFSGCCYGAPWSGPLSVVYGGATNCPVPGVPLFPLQLVTVLSHLAIFVAVLRGIAQGRSLRWFWFMEMLNLAVYYGNIYFTPMHPYRRTESLLFIIFALLGAGVLWSLKYMERKNENEKDFKKMAE